MNSCWSSYEWSLGTPKGNPREWAFRYEDLWQRDYPQRRFKAVMLTPCAQLSAQEVSKTGRDFGSRLVTSALIGLPLQSRVLPLITDLHLHYLI